MAMNGQANAPQRTPSRTATSGSRDGDPQSEQVEPVDEQSAADDTADPSMEETDGAEDASGFNDLPSEQEYRGWFSKLKKKVTKTVKSVATQIVKPALQAALPIGGTAVGGFFGGPAGAAIGGKAGGIVSSFFREVPETAEQAQARMIRQANEVEEHAAQLDAISTQVIDQTLPVLIDEIAREVTESGMRGTEGPVDDEVMERFWGKAFSTIAAAAAAELPWAIKKATQYLDDYASRDTDTIDPLMIDPEIAQRFWAPAFSTIMAGIQSSLPEAFAMIAGGSRAFEPDDGTIDWQQLESAARLPGGDDITVVGTSAIEDPTMVEIALEIPKHKSWWKSIQCRGADDSVIASLEVEGSQKTHSFRVPADALQGDGARLVFAKADGVYALPAKSIPALAGQRVDFYWYAG